VDVLTKLDPVFERNATCPGCGSVLGLKFILQSLEDTKNVVIVTSPGEITELVKSLKVPVVNSSDPASTARGLAVAMPESRIIVYAGDGYTANNMTSLLSVTENVLYICYNNSNQIERKEFVKAVSHLSSYSATANVAYYEDFVAKLRKVFSKSGFRFIDLLCPCPARWGFDKSNTIEVGRMATESCVWPLYEVDGIAAITKIPPRQEPVTLYLEMLRIKLPEEKVRSLQESVNKNWRALGESKLV